MSKDIITIGGVQYEYIDGQYTSGENACEHCALNGICNKGSYNSIICKITKHLDDNTGNYQPIKAEPQPKLMKEYYLNPWDADIVKRILRTKQGDSRRLDYEKIIHICEERIRQIDTAGE